MWYPFPAGQISLKAAAARARGREVSVSRMGAWTAPQPHAPQLTSAVGGAALAPCAPGLAHAAAAELAGEARGQWVLALVLRAHQAETQALLLWLVRCRGPWAGMGICT